MPKHDFIHEFKLGHDASEISANINNAEREKSKSNWTVEKFLKKFRSTNENLEEEGRE